MQNVERESRPCPLRAKRQTVIISLSRVRPSTPHIFSARRPEDGTPTKRYTQPECSIRGSRVVRSFQSKFLKACDDR